jgi:nucleotide-binding universal stress UspA family protein
VPVFVVHGDTRIQREGPVFRSIAVAVDDSEPADAAIAFATELGTANHSKMTFVTVIDSDALHEQIALYGGYAETIQHEWETEARHLADGAARHARRVGLPASEVVAFGETGGAVAVESRKSACRPYRDRYARSPGFATPADGQCG